MEFIVYLTVSVFVSTTDNVLESELDTYNSLVFSLKIISLGFCPTGTIFFSRFVVPSITETELESVLVTYNIAVLLLLAMTIAISLG